MPPISAPPRITRIEGWLTTAPHRVADQARQEAMRIWFHPHDWHPWVPLTQGRWRWQCDGCGIRRADEWMWWRFSSLLRSRKSAVSRRLRSAYPLGDVELILAGLSKEDV